MQVWRESRDALAPGFTIGTFLDGDLRGAHVPAKGPSRATGWLLFAAKGFTQALNEAGHFKERKGVVDGVAAEGVADTAGDDEGELLGEDGGGGLLAGGATAEVEARDEDVCLFVLVSGEVKRMSRKGGDKPPARAMLLKAGS